MPRLQVIDPATAEGKIKEIFDGPLKGKHLNIFKGLANSVTGLMAYFGLAGALNESSLSALEREIIQLAIGESNGCAYCLAAHTKIGIGAGMSEAQTIAARTSGDLGDAKLNALLAFTNALHEKRGFVANEDLVAFKNAGYTDASVVEVIVTYTQATMTNIFNHVNETDIDFPAPPAV